MKATLQYKFILLALATAATPLRATSATLADTPPQLLVNVLIEGLSTEQLRNLESVLGPDGLCRITSHAAYADMLYYGPGADATASATMLLTGAPPAVNGIPAERVYDPARRTSRQALYDHTKLGNFTDQTLSPSPIRASTLADELAINTSGQAKIYSVAPAAGPAIAGAGHAGTGAYWINPMTANWATTTYYTDIAEPVRQRNYKRSLSHRLDTMKWVTPGATPSSAPITVAFPSTDVHRIHRYIATPLVNSEVTDIAIDLIHTYQLGADGIPDMLTVTYTLGTGNSYTQQIDAYKRLDHDLTRLFTAIDKTAGADKALVMLAGLPNPNGQARDDARWRIPYGQFSTKKAQSLLAIHLMSIHGPGEWINGFHNNSLYLNNDLIKQRGLDAPIIRREAAEFLDRMAGVSSAYTIDDIMAARAGDNAEALRRNTVIEYAGDVTLNINPGWEIIDATDAKPGARRGVERHTAPLTPLYIYHPSITTRSLPSPMDARTVAPTLAGLMRIRAPNAASLPPAIL